MHVLHILVDIVGVIQLVALLILYQVVLFISYLVQVVIHVFQLHLHQALDILS